MILARRPLRIGLGEVARPLHRRGSVPRIRRTFRRDALWPRPAVATLERASRRQGHRRLRWSPAPYPRTSSPKADSPGDRRFPSSIMPPLPRFKPVIVDGWLSSTASFTWFMPAWPSVEPPLFTYQIAPRLQSATCTPKTQVLQTSIDISSGFRVQLAVFSPVATRI